MAYEAITFDTQTVMSNGFDFENGLLAQLKQFKTGPVKVVVSDVIVREIERRLTEKTQEMRDKIEAAHRDGVKFGLTTGKKGPVADADASKIAKDRLKKFLDDIGADVIPADDVAIEDVLTRYFSHSPPFSPKKGKQKEFPDAIALLALEAWAAKSKKMMLAVSGDDDWAQFAKKSKVVGYAEELGEALQAFQKGAAAAVKIADAILDRIENKRADTVSEIFLGALADEVGNRKFEVSADSMFDLEQETLELSVHTFRFPAKSSAPRFKIVGLRDQYLAIEMPISVEAEVSVTFAFYGSSVALGSVDLSKKVKFDATFLIVFEGDLVKGEVWFVAVDMVQRPPVLDLGNVDRDIDFGEDP